MLQSHAFLFTLIYGIFKIVISFLLGITQLAFVEHLNCSGKEVRSYSDALTLKSNEYAMSLESKQKNTAQKNIKNIRIYQNFIMVFGPTCIYQTLYKFVMRDWIRYVQIRGFIYRYWDLL